MIVMKFGGTSVGDAAAVRRLAEIVASRLARQPVVVVSAVAGTTDALLQLAGAAARGETPQAEEIGKTILSRHERMIAELRLEEDPSLPRALREAREGISAAAAKLSSGREGERIKEWTDEILAFGEFLSSRLVAAHLRAAGIPAEVSDAREILRTDSQFGKAQPLLEESGKQARERLLPLVEGRVVPVVQGFVGRDGQGRTTTLGRGGSDYSATLLGALLGASAVEIWSDVDGVMTADPNLVPEAKRIRSMTFQEAAELAYFGAKVLHPATIQPAVEQGIPVFVLNSRRPGDSGTEITAEGRPGPKKLDPLIKSIAYKRGLTVITVKSTRMLMAYGFLASIFEVFHRYRTSVDLVSTSEVSVSITVDSTEHLDEIREELSRFSQVEVEQGKAIVCVVGENMRRAPGIPARVFSGLDDLPIHMVSQGASEINVSFVVDEEDVPAAVRRLHHKFFDGPLDEEVFVSAGATETR